MGTSNRALNWTKILLVSIAAAASDFLHIGRGGGGAGYMHSTPYMPGGGHRKQPRHKPYIPDGKYVMKFHRNTHRMKRRRHVCQPV